MTAERLVAAREAVAAARRTGAWSSALALVQQRWREEPSEDVAEVLERLSAEANRTLPRPRFATATEFHQHWCAVARGEASLGPQVGPAWALGWLASHLVFLLPRTDFMSESPAEVRCRLLERLGPDPRTAAAICAGWAVGEGSPSHPANQLVAVRLLPLLARMNDRRAATFVKRRAAEAPGAPWFDPGLMATFEAIPSSPAPEWRELLSSVEETEFLARIAHAPGDLQLRRVLADRLQEQGDPRGEFIALQMDSGGEKGARRASALLKAHRRTWLGSLDEVLTSVRFELGFPVEATLKATSSTLPEVVDRLVQDPRLATLETLWPGRSRPAHYLAFVTSAVMVGLGRIGLSSADAIELLLRHRRPLPVFHLRFDENDFTEQQLRRLATSVAVPALRSVEVTAGTSSTTEDRLAERLKKALGPRLRELHFNTNHPPRALRLWSELSLEALGVTCPVGWCELTPTVLRASAEFATRPDLLAGSLPPGVTVVFEGPVSEEQRQLVETKLARPVRIGR